MSLNVTNIPGHFSIGRIFNWVLSVSGMSVSGMSVSARSVSRRSVTRLSLKARGGGAFQGIAVSSTRLSNDKILPEFVLLWSCNASA